MTFIDAANQEQLRTRFERGLEGDVRLVLFVQPPSGLYVPGREEPSSGRETQQLMEELAALSPKLHLEVHNPRLEPELAASYDVVRSPALLLLPGVPTPDGDVSPKSEVRGPKSGNDFGLVRFFGLPSGYEFMTLLEDIADVSRRQTRLSAGSRQIIDALPEPVHLQVFVTPT